MKKRFSLFLILALLPSLLAGCAAGKPDPAPGTSRAPAMDPAAMEAAGFTVFPEGDYLADPVLGSDKDLPEYDYDASYEYQMNPMCSTEDALYFAVQFPSTDENLLYYMDKATGICGPLCGRPDCTHSDANCNAYMGRQVECLCDYGGRLYWAVSGVDGRLLDWQVRSAALDGTDHREGKVLSVDVVGTTRNLCYSFFHRGCFYMSYLSEDIVDGTAVETAKVAALPLEGGEEGFTVFQTAWEGGDMKAVPFRDGLYLVLSGYPGGTVRDSGQENRQLILYRWDIQTRTAETLVHQNYPVDMGYECCVTEDGVILQGWPYEDGKLQGRNLYRYSFESGEIEHLYEYAPKDDAHSGHIAGDMLVGSMWTGEGNLHLLVKDFAGGTVLDTSIGDIEWYDPDRFDQSIRCVGADEAYMYLRYGNKIAQYSLIAVPWDGSEARLLHTWQGAAD